MFNFLNFFKKEKYVLVKTFKTNNNTYTYHIHLYETISGKRKAEFKCDGNTYYIDRRDGWLKKQDIYQLKIYRWLEGRMDPEIPRADQVPEEDTANYLKGKI